MDPATAQNADFVLKLQNALPRAMAVSMELVPHIPEYTAWISNAYPAPEILKK